MQKVRLIPPPHCDITLGISQLTTAVALWLCILSGLWTDCHASGSAPFASGYNVRYYTMSDGLPHNYIQIGRASCRERV